MIKNNNRIISSNYLPFLNEIGALNLAAALECRERCTTNAGRFSIKRVAVHSARTLHFRPFAKDAVKELNNGLACNDALFVSNRKVAREAEKGTTVACAWQKCAPGRRLL